MEWACAFYGRRAVCILSYCLGTRGQSAGIASSRDLGSNEDHQNQFRICPLGTAVYTLYPLPGYDKHHSGRVMTDRLCICPKLINKYPEVFKWTVILFIRGW